MIKDNDKILEERALRLSRAKVDFEDEDNGLPALIFSLRTERFALPLPNVIEVIQLPEPVQIPGMPDFVTGFIQRQGKIIPLINLRLALGSEQRGLVDLSKVIIVQASRLVFGIQAENVEGLKRLSDDQMLKGQNHTLITATYTNGIVMLNPEAIQSALTTTNY